MSGRAAGWYERSEPCWSSADSPSLTATSGSRSAARPTWGIKHAPFGSAAVRVGRPRGAMGEGEAWFTVCADELARCLVDARNCAEVCEAYLAALDGAGDDLRRAVDVLAAPAAVSRILIELIDQPPQSVLAAARLCRELATAAADELGGPR